MARCRSEYFLPKNVKFAKKYGDLTTFNLLDCKRIFVRYTVQSFTAMRCLLMVGIVVDRAGRNACFVANECNQRLFGVLFVVGVGGPRTSES